MASHPTGLGKGLDALIRETNEPFDPSHIRVLPLDDIVPNPRQPRREFSEKSLEDLAASIKSQGVLQPLLVRPVGASQPGKYEIVAGERRWRASRIAGLAEVPVFVRSFSPQDTLAAALIENLQREDLNPIEEAEGIRVLKEEFGLSQDDLATKIGKSRSAIANTLRLLTLPEPIRQLLADGRLSSGHARAVLGISDDAARQELVDLILDKKLSVREAESLAFTWKNTGAFDAAAQGAKADKAARQRAQAVKNEHMAHIQQTFEDLYQVSVKVSGKENKGRISFAFNSKEELEALLQRLSANALAGSKRDALPASKRQALAHAEKEALEASELEALASNGLEVLEASGHAALAGSSAPKLDGGKAGVLAGASMQSLGTAGMDSLDANEMTKLASAGHMALDGQRADVLEPAPERPQIAGGNSQGALAAEESGVQTADNTEGAE
ncbi:ParB/RepB/Spo0J family partition protein [Desulfovibrio sp. OttesenSCG-928-G15]|nr:ParB/RepB/Spo0J family partition protein [Desulfovibrio sp. OttesenSCG-928-G15]